MPSVRSCPIHWALLSHIRHRFGSPDKSGSYKVLVISLLTISLFHTRAAASESREHLVVWAMGEEGKKIAQMARRFEEANPGVTIETQAVPWEAAHAKLLTSVVGGIPPDVSQMGTTWMAEFVAMGALAPLDDRARNSATARPDAFFPGSLQTCLVNDELYGIPWYVDTRVLFYRKDLLAEVGFRRPPQTWEELRTAARRLSERPGKGGRKNYGIALGTRGWTELLTAVWQNGGDPLRPSAPEFAEAMEHYVGFFRDGSAPTKEAADVNLFHAFDTGYLPMFISGPWMVELIGKELPGLRGQWGVSVLPGRKTRTSFVGGSNLVVFNGSRKKDLAGRFIEFMSDPDNQVEWYRLTTDLPSSKAAWARDYFKDQEMLRVFGEQMYDTASPPTVPEWEQVASAIEVVMEKIILQDPAQDNVMRQHLLKLESEILQLTRPEKRGAGSGISIGILVFAVIAIGWAVARRRKKAGEAAFWSLGDGKDTIGYVFILPAGILLFLFLFLPVAVSFLMSLTDLNILSINNWDRISFIDLDNYRRLLKDPIFWKSLGNTLYFAGVGVPLTIAVSLAAAVALNQPLIKFRSLFRFSLFAPVVTTIVAVAVVWRWLYNPEYGVFNWMLQSMGFEPLHWLADPKTALPSLILLAVWKNFGYNMVIFLAGLQTIPETQYEAARIDGANAWQSFRFVTLPGLAPTMLFVVVLSTIGYLQFFAEPYVMTKGGPLDSTLSIVLYMYNHAFRFFNLGYASAISYALFGLIFVFTLVQFKLKKGGFEAA